MSWARTSHDCIEAAKILFESIVVEDEARVIDVDDLDCDAEMLFQQRCDVVGE